MADQIPVEGKHLVFLIDLANGTSYGGVVCLDTVSMALAANVITSASRCGTVKYNGDKDRTIQLSGFYVFSPTAPTHSAGDIVDAFENDTRFGWLFGPETPVDGEEYYTGIDALFSNVEIGAPQEGGATFSATVQLTGVPVHHIEGS
jgi:hypothetical protein